MVVTNAPLVESAVVSAHSVGTDIDRDVGERGSTAGDGRAQNVASVGGGRQHIGLRIEGIVARSPG